MGTFDIAGGAAPSMPSLSNIRQQEAVRAFVRLGGAPRQGKGSHLLVKFGPHILSFPAGILKRNLLRSQLKLAGITEEEFLKNL